MKSKSQELAASLSQRIRRGDYDLRGFPSVHALMEEFDISRNTTYKILDLLVEEGLLARKENGRLQLSKENGRSGEMRRVAFLQPAFTSDHFDMVTGVWRRGLDKAVAGRQVQIRPLIYTDYDDPVIREAVNAFEGVFFFAMPAPVPDHIIELFQSRVRQVVSLGCDLSAHGIRSVRLCSSLSLHCLLDHLASLGHRQIDCLNVHPTSNSDVEERIRSWEIWRRAHDLPGQLINEPVPALGVPFDHAFQQAHSALKQLLDDGEFRATALFCVSMPAALGAMRALTEAGLEVGRDVSVCAAVDEGMCRYLSPSLTALDLPDPAPYLDLCLEKILFPKLDWDGSLLLQPNEAELFVGDSTGPCSGRQNEIEHNPTPRQAEAIKAVSSHSTPRDAS